MRKVIIYFLTCCMVLNTSLPVVMATPTPDGGGFTVGTGSITSVGNATNVVVDQAQSVINWTSLNTLGGSPGVRESLNFSQGSLSNSAVLNRVSGAVTQFNGDLNATGMRIFIVNPAGVVFGDGATVNVTQLVASGLGMTNTNFSNAAGDPTQPMIFSGGSGDVTNNGTITATNSVYLVGEDVINNGAIFCPGGLVVLAAGDALRLGQPDSSVIVDIGTDLIADGSNDIRNNGTVGEGGSPVGELVLASGDVFSQAIGNVGDLAVVANENVELNGDIAVTGSVDVLGGQNASTAADIDVHGHITAASIRLKNGADTGPDAVGEKTDSPIVVDDTKNLTATDGDVVVEAVHDILLGGNIEATGDIYLNADEDGHGDPREPEYSEYPDGGGDIIAHGTLTAGGNIDILANAIRFEANVTATDGDLTLTGRTSRDSAKNTQVNNGRWGVIQAADGTTLSAGRNVSIIDGGGGPEDHIPSGTMMLTGEESLAIVAGAADGVDDGQIIVENTAISVVGATSLTLQQDLDIDLGDDQWIFDNQGETDLTLISNEGSVTAVHWDHPLNGNNENAAGQWESVGAEARGDIELTDWDDIRTRELLSHEGDITVDSWDGAIEAREDITAEQGDVTLAVDYDECIYSWADIYAGRNVDIKDPLILLGGEWVWDDTASGWRKLYGETEWFFFEDGAWIWQGNQYITAENGILTAESWIRKYTPGELHMYAGWDSSDGHPAIDLLYPGSIEYGDPTVLTAGNLYMRSVGDVQIAGDITSRGWMRSEGEVHEAYPGGQLFESDYEWGDPVMWPWAEGGVSIISEQGKIYTRPQISGLNVTIEGFSDDITYRADDPQFAEMWYGEFIYECGPYVIWNAPLNDAAGVDLPYGPGKAAVVLVSADDLKFGPESITRAYGMYGFAEQYGLEGIDNWDEFEAYIAENPVLSYIDDRPGVGFLDVPAEIGGFDREPGLPIDVAVYAQSTEGDVVLAEEADIVVVSVLPDYDGPENGYIFGATVVLDAYDTVSFEGLQEQMFGFDNLDEFRSFLGNLGSFFGYDIDLAGFQNAGNQALINLGYIKNASQFATWATENFGIFKEFVIDFFLDYFKDFDFRAYFREHGFRLEGFRLEACSRRTGTLGRAIAEGTLPFADSPWVKEWLLINDYVLRGEGNLDINSAWVLNNNSALRPEPTPGAMQPFVPAAPIPERVAFEISGYPALMNWVAKELGIDKGMIQIGMANTLASARDIQPYRTLARLKAAATVLQDADGTRVAALAQIISQFASSTAPPTEEQMASIADAIANDIEGNSQYAAAGEYLDALAKYVSILNSEMGFSADESIQFATDNYVEKLVESENMAVAAYVAARLAALGGS